MTLDFQDFRTVEKAKAVISSLEKAFGLGNGRAGYVLSIIYSEGNTFIHGEVRDAVGVSDERAADYTLRSFPLLLKEAEAGNGESMHLLSYYYGMGLPPVAPDKNLRKYWLSKAADAGHVCVQDLLALYGDPKSEFYDAEKARRLNGLL